MAWSVALGTATLAALLACATLAGPAGADIYWAKQHFPRKPASIGCARDNGSHVNPRLIRRDGVEFISLAADRRHVYWNDEQGSIGRVKVNGRKLRRKFIPNAGVSMYTNALATDGAFLYWTAPGGSIARAAIDGTGIDHAFIPGVDAMTIGVGGGRLVWTAPQSVATAAVDGTGVATVLTDLYPVYESSLDAVATDGVRAFWSFGSVDYGSHFEGFKISSANLDGTEHVEALVRRVEAWSIAVDGGHLYWADGEYGIGRVNLDGTGLRPKFIRTKDPYTLAVGPARSCPRPKKRR